MTKFLIDPGELARFAAGRPAILLAGASADAAPFADSGLVIWFGRLDGDSALIGPSADARATGEEVEIPAAPSGIVAVLFTADEPETAWRSWFAAAPDQRGPAFAPADPPAAFRAITKRLLAEQTRNVSDAADLHLALARVRQEYEQSMTVSQGLVQALGHQAPGELTLRCAAEAGEETARLDATHPILLQRLGVRLDTIAAVAIAVQDAKTGAEDGLRVRLSGIESGRIFGSWRVPGEALVSGWLVLDLPSPVGWAPETAQIELHFTCGRANHLDLSLDPDAAFPENWLARPGANAVERALAVRVWSAETGRNYVLAEHFDWSEIGSSAGLDGIPLAMPLAAYTRMRVLGGAMPRRYHPDQPDPMVLGVFAGKQTLAIFPQVCTGGMDVIEAEFGLRGGNVRKLMVALWLQPLGRLVRGEADLLAASREVVWSGWRRFSDEGLARVTLELPVGAAANLQLVVVADAKTVPGAGVSLLEIHQIMFHALNPGTKSRRRARLVGAKTAKGGPPPRTLAWPAETLEGAETPVGFREVILDEHFDNGGSYRHLDMRLSHFGAGDYYWPFLKFRVVVERGAAALEFRDIPGWPPSLKRWPAARSDQHGRLVRLFGEESELAAWRDQAAPQDLALLRGLVACLPGVVARAALMAHLSAHDYTSWSEIGEELAAKLAAHAALGRA